jgi:AhpD family alkylhydroperoxidase
VSWVSLLDCEDLPPHARAVAESGQAQYGGLLNTWRALFHRPDIFATYLPFLRAVAGPGTVDLATKDLCAVLVGVLNGCRYTVSHRCASAARNGVPAQTLERVVAGRWDDLDPALRDALRFTRVLTVAPAVVPYSTEPGLIPAPLRSSLATWYGEDQLVELTLNVSVWNALTRFHRVMQFDLDMPEPPAAADPARCSDYSSDRLGRD